MTISAPKWTLCVIALTGLVWQPHVVLFVILLQPHLPVMSTKEKKGKERERKKTEIPRICHGVSGFGTIGGQAWAGQAICLKRGSGRTLGTIEVILALLIE
jgi:hypothetical protein